MLGHTVRKTAFLSLLVFLLPSGGLAGQTNARTTTSGGIYENDTLNFRYRPPDGMQDKTADGRAMMQRRASAVNASKVFDLLLAMESSQVDSPSWRSVTVEAYPRDAILEPDDLRAEAQMSAWVAGALRARGTPKQTAIAGQNFAISVLGLREGSTTKGAVVWTTIRKGKLLSFAFVANSPEQLKVLTETMKSVEFY
jgi:hypothetical protein